MNIFQLSETGCPVEAAEMQCDDHVNKMFLESVQLLTNCFPEDMLWQLPKTEKGSTRKYGHYNHPSAKWVRQSKQNFDWMIKHCAALEKARLDRNFNPHFSSECFHWICQNQHNTINLPDIGITPFAVAINDDKECRKRIRNFNDLPVYQQYRLFYVFDKLFAKWNRLNNTPQWFLDMRQKYANVLV